MLYTSMITNDPYPAYALKIAGPRGLDPILSHKAAKRAYPEMIACPDCKGGIHGCVHCNWYGVIPKNAPHCTHVFSTRENVGKCLNRHTCVKCSRVITLDSSD